MIGNKTRIPWWSFANCNAFCWASDGTQFICISAPSVPNLHSSDSSLWYHEYCTIHIYVSTCCESAFISERCVKQVGSVLCGLLYLQACDQYMRCTYKSVYTYNTDPHTHSPSYICQIPLNPVRHVRVSSSWQHHNQQHAGTLRACLSVAFVAV